MKFELKSGTKIKHGTTLKNLKGIASTGLIPGRGRSELRSISESLPVHQAVYVGQLAAYFGAWAAHAAELKAYYQAVPDFAEKCEGFRNAPITYSWPEAERIPLSLPVVLNINLKRDVEFVGDEDFSMLSTPAAGPEKVWQEWQSGALMVDAIPADWIQSFEYPRLIKLDDRENSGVIGNIIGDVDLFVLACKSSAMKIEPARIQLNQKTLSQTRAFSESGVDAFLQSPHLRDKKTLFYNQIMQFSYFNQLAEQRGMTAFKY